ncbi:hypothetical protein AA3250_0448 [Gluconobacter albidus NBRC 3250]|nr:hypothetical protein AA3250_0448 [Gluconobacter albidus NBRC 3250]
MDDPLRIGESRLYGMMPINPVAGTGIAGMATTGTATAAARALTGGAGRLLSVCGRRGGAIRGTVGGGTGGRSSGHKKHIIDNRRLT